MHVSTDSWVGGYLPDFEQMQKDFPSIAPEDLGSVGYDGEETMYVSEAVFEAAYSQAGLILDHHKGYNRSHGNAKVFFDSVTDIQVADLKLCVDSELNNPSRMEPYARFSKDSDGVVTVDAGIVAKCSDGYWWRSPACRDDVAGCIPLITGGNGWRIQALMQWATAYDMPVAVAVAKAWGDYVNLISSKRVLFYWWVPDSTFIQMQPHQVHFPRNNPKEWALGDKKTSLATSYISNMVSADLATKASKVRSFMSNVRFSLLEVQEMLLQISEGSSNSHVACQWIQDNEAVWSQWIPVDTNCQEGFGMVDAAGHFVETRSAAVACDLCSAGTYSKEIQDDGLGKTFRCSLCPPGYSQENTYSTKCEPCARGMVSNKFGSTSCVPCGVGEYQPLQAQESCLACNESRTTQLRGATSPQDCVCKMDFIEDMDLQCIACREGVLCPLGSTMSKLLNSSGSSEEPRIQLGYSSQAIAPLDTYRCPESACPGGRPGACSGGLTGATCGACPEKQFFAEDSGACTACASEASWMVGLLGFLMILVMGLAGSYYMLPSKYRATASAGFMFFAMGGLTVATFQIFGVIGTSLKDMTYSSAFLDFGAFFLLEGESLGVSCLGTTTASFAMTAVVFWIIPGCLVLLGCLSHLIPILKRKKLTWERRKVISLIGSFLQTAFTTMASLALVPFMCFKHPIGKYSVLKYPDIFCGSPEHSLMHWAGASLILLATAFVTFCAFGAVKAPALAARSSKYGLQMFTFLLHRFRPNSWWFGLVILGKGCGVSLPPVFFANQPGLLQLFIMLVLQLYLCILLWCMPWKTPLLNLVDVTSTALLVTLLAVFLSGAGLKDAQVTDGLQLFVSSCIVGSLLLATLAAAMNFGYRSVTGSPLDLWWVNLGKPPRGEDIFTGLEDVADYIKDAGRTQKDSVVMILEQLSTYDIDSIMKSLSILHDELQMETSSGNFGNRIAHSHRKITSRESRGSARGAQTAGDFSRDSARGDGDNEPTDVPLPGPATETTETVEVPAMQEEMYDNPEGKQVTVSHVL